MKNLSMFCLTLEPSHYQFIKDLNYIPVGLGKNKFMDEVLSDKSGDSISNKNRYYGEYTFHYWLWKNYLNTVQSEWIGFCQYRKFWTLEKYNHTQLELKKLNEIVLKEVPEKLNSYESILGRPFVVNKQKTMKFLKKGFKLIVKNPSYLFKKSSRNIKFHFDLMHGENNLDKAIDLLDKENKDHFRTFVNTNYEFNPQNMFICRSKKILTSYYETLFPWLEKCEELFGFDKLKGYDLTRIYGFLAERFLSYWFQKNTKYITLPITFYDIRNDIN